METENIWESAKLPRALTAIEQRFCHQFVISGGRIREAYRLAFRPGKGTTVAQIAQACAELLCDDVILQAIDQVRRSTRITAQSVLDEMGHIAFSDPGELFDDEGNCIPIRQLPRNVRAAIAGFEVERRTRGTGENAEVYHVLKYKLWNKNDAASDLMRHLGLFEKDNLQIGGLLDGIPVKTAELVLAKLQALAMARGAGTAQGRSQVALLAPPAAK